MSDYIRRFDGGLEYDPEGEYCLHDEAAEIIARKNMALREALEQLTGPTANRWDAQQAMAARIRKELGND